jgi:hypothetical protein
MTIVMLVHSMHQLCICLQIRRVNRRQLEQDIPIKGWWKELYPLDVKTVKIKCFEYVPSAFCSPNSLQGIDNTKRLLMTNVRHHVT